MRPVLGLGRCSSRTLGGRAEQTTADGEGAASEVTGGKQVVTRDYKEGEKCRDECGGLANISIGNESKIMGT